MFFVSKKVWTVCDNQNRLLGKVEGMPIQLGWASTIHRAQGLTLPAVKADVRHSWEPGQAYVALSRTRSLDQLSLHRPVAEIKANRIVLTYLKSEGLL